MLGVSVPASMNSVSRSRSAARCLGDEVGQPLAQERGQGQGSQRAVHAAGPAAAGLAADDHGRPGRGEGAAQPCDGGVPGDVEDQVVVVGAVGEVVAGVVDDVVGAEGSHQVELRGAAHAGDLGAEGLGQLHGVAADAAGCADDQHVLARLDPAVVGQRLQRGGGRDRHDGGLLEGEVARLAGELVLAGHGVLGERALADAEHLVADGEPGHRRADRDDGAGDVEPGHRVLRPAEPEREAAPGRAGPSSGARCPGRDRPRAPAPAPRSSATSGRAISRDAQHVRRAVRVLHDRPHRVVGLRERFAQVARHVGPFGESPRCGWPRGGFLERSAYLVRLRYRTKYGPPMARSDQARVVTEERDGRPQGQPPRIAPGSAGSACCAAPSRSPTPGASDR